MKLVVLKKLVQLSVLFFTVLVFLGDALAHDALMTKEEAVEFAEKSAEAQAFLAIKDGAFAGCIEKKVDLPCDSQWVTCIEDAWVVKFIFSEDCQKKHDGRLSLTLLIDAKERKIISRFPEKDYFLNPQHCLEDYDCMAIDTKDTASTQCLNFIYAQIGDDKLAEDHRCSCIKSVCQ